MPNGDQTGPAGTGSQTGRRMGYCTGNEAPGWPVAGGGRGFHRGFRCNGRARGLNARGMFRRLALRGTAPAGSGSLLLEEMEALRMQVAALGKQMVEKKD